MTVSRRHFLVASLAALGAFARNVFGSQKNRDCTSASWFQSRAKRCRPVISGPLWWYDRYESKAWGISGWRDELDQQARLRFNLLWLCNAPSGLASDEDAEILVSLMDLCARRNVRVILDTGTSPSWYERLDLKSELQLCSFNVTRLAERFADHPAFFAWYIPHEIYVFEGIGASYIEKLYASLVEICKRAAEKPVTVSPFFILDKDKVFGDFKYVEPRDYQRYWKALIRASGFDIVMLQDSGEHFAYVTNEMRRPFFEAMYEACKSNGARFWGNVETAEYDCPSKEEFVRRYGRIHHSQAKGLSWRPVPIDRLKEKLELAAEYSEEIVTWGYREFCRPALGETALSWYEQYRAYVREATATRGF